MDYLNLSEPESESSSGYRSVRKPRSHLGYQKSLINDSDSSSDENVTSEDGKPIQVIRIEKNSEDNTQLILNSNNLDHVLGTCKDRPICIISSVGAPRTGKSFLLNCIKEKVKSFDKETRPVRDGHKNYTGFNFRPGYKADTRGIWVWSKAFIVNGEDQDEIAVILMDTEGINDELLNPEEISAIIGIPLACSAHFILNFSGELSSVPFNWVSKFVGKISEEEIVKPCQKMSVVVHDWTQIHTYKYGERGGKKRFARFLKSHDKQVSPIMNAFEEVNCHLLPNIGEKAMDPSFKGKSADLDKTFSKVFEKYTSGLVSKLSAKKILECDVKGPQLKQFLAEYVEFLNYQLESGTAMKSNAFTLFTKTTAGKIMVEQGMEEYHKHIQQGRKSAAGAFLKEKDLDKLHAQAKKKALVALEMFSLSDDEERKVRSQLEEGISLENRNLKSRHVSAHKQNIKNNLEKACFNLRSKLEAKFPFTADRGEQVPSNLVFYDEDDLSTFMSQAVEEIKLDFLEEFAAKDEDLQAELESELQDIQDKYYFKNRENEARALEKAKDATEQLMKEYTSGMRKKTRRFPKLDLGTLGFIHDDMVENVETKFEKVELCTSFKADLWIKLLEIMEHEHNKFQCDLESIMTQVMEEIEAEKETYRKSMDDMAKNTNEEIKQFHETNQKQILHRFHQKYPFQVGSPKFEEMSTKLALSLNAVYEDILQQRSLLKAKLQRIDSKRVVGDVKVDGWLDVKHSYAEDMDKAFDNQKVGYFDDEEFERLSSRCRDIAIQSVNVEAHFNENQLKIINERIDKLDEKYKDQNEVIKLSHSEDDIAIGIDLGTTFCCVAAYVQGKVRVLDNRVGTKITPSYVTINPDGSTKVGHYSKDQAWKNPESTVFDAKRIIGRKWSDEKLQEDMQFWPFSVMEHEGGAKIKVHGKLYNPEEISCMILKHLKNEAEETLNTKISKAVITVPAYFTDGQRKATIDAGEEAGLKVLAILNEPTAAAIAYRLEWYSVGKPRNILVYDLGGGTFDVAILAMSDNKLDVLSVSGDAHLGGEDFDRNMMTYCAEQFQGDIGIDVFDGKDSEDQNTKNETRKRIKRLQLECESGKKDLVGGGRFNINTTISIDNFIQGEDLEVDINRQIFDDRNNILFGKTITIVDDALSAAKLKKEDIDDVVLVGGSTRIPTIQAMLKKHFNGKPLNKKINPDEAVAYGAAVQAAILNAKPGKKVFDFGQIQEITPMSLGIALANGDMDVLIKRGTKIPHVHKEEYHTTKGNQTSVSIKIFQGDEKKVAANKLLGNFNLIGIPPNIAGVESVEVTMKINLNGILSVEAMCTSTQERMSITISDTDRPAVLKRKKLLAEAD